MELFVNNIDKYNNRIENNNKKEKINFTKNPKDICVILKKKMNKEFLMHKGQNHISIKNKKIFNSNKYYIYNVINNKIFIMLNFFMIFVFISLSKQNSDFELESMQKIIITITGPGMRIIFSNDFRYQPSALYIEENEIDLEKKSYFNTFNLLEEENIIKVYYSNPPENFNSMFKNNYYIKKVDLTNIDTSKVTDMNSMFSNCIGLEYVNITGIDTSSVTDMGLMFKSCLMLTSLDLSSFNTSSVLNMNRMFFYCENLTYLNIPHFNTTSVETMSEMFSYCKNLESLDLSSFKTNKDLDISKMFYNCKKLKSIKFPEKNKILGSNMEYLFHNCSSLISLDLSSFDTSYTSKINNMFDGCTNLTSIDLSNFNTSKVTNMDNMFKECTKLEFLDLSNFKTNSLNSMEGMLRMCSSLIYLNMKSLVIHDSINTNYIFSGCSDKLILCCEKEYESKIKRDKILISNCSDICFSDTRKIITELNKCVEDCNTDNNEYKYEYNNKCYIDCPDGTISSSNDEFLCIETDCVYYNMDRTECFKYIPEGYYIYNKKDRIIAQCHENCKTCNKKEDENNNNCITCKNGYFFEEGNCVTECKYNSYIDENGNNICTCSSNIKCKECSEESLKDDLCISCNNEGGFYSTYYENIDDNFINCYKNFTGYYLVDNQYYPCFFLCHSCSKVDDVNSHNCDECNAGYTLLNETGKKGNCYLKCNNYYYFDESNVYKCTDKNECPPLYNKLIPEKRKCINECSYDDTYKYEYNNTCYKKCPNNQICKNIVEEDTITQVILDSTNHVSITEELTPQVTENIESQTTEAIQINIDYSTESQKITEEITLQITQDIESQATKETQINIQAISDTQKITEELIPHITQNTERQTDKETQYNFPTISDTQNFENNWSSGNFFIGLIEKKELNLSKDNIIDNIKDDIINHKMDYLLSNVTAGNKEDLYIKDEDISYQITTTDNQNNNIYNNISTIKLGECENILKKIYDIDRNLSLIIFKIDYYLEGLLIPIIGYDVYHPKNKSKLNLSYCNETSISYNIPVSIDENNLFKYDQNSEYYNDECSTHTTEDGTDILINDRKEEFIQNNMSLCENICTYIGYDQNTKKALCQCGIKYQEFILSEIDKQNDLLSINLTTDDSSNSNLGTMKCYETLFSKEGLLTNIGSYILIFIIFIHMISIILFYKCGYFILENKIKDIISKLKKRRRSIKSPKAKDKKKNIKKKKKSIFKVSNPSKKVKKSIKNRISTQEKIEKDIYKFYKLKLKENKKNKFDEKEQNGSKIPLRNLSDKPLKFNSKIKKNSIINLNNLNNYNDYELNSLNYNDALIIDKRTYLQYYISLLKTKNQIIFTFCPIKDDNVFIIKICLFGLSFSIYYFFNTVFFSCSIIHKVYEDKGSYNASYFMPIIIYSFLISYYINILIKFISLSERNLAEIKKEKIIKNLFDKKTKVQRCLIIKYILYFTLSCIFLFFFWYYLSSFCAVYQNSQVFVIKNTFISYIIGLIYPCFTNLLPGILRLYSLNTKKGKRVCIYKFSQFLQFF